jgi:hypothetical protein
MQGAFGGNFQKKLPIKMGKDGIQRGLVSKMVGLR